MQKFTKVLSLVVLVMMEVMTSFSHAITSQVRVSVTFNSNGGSEVEGVTVLERSSVSAPETPIRDGYEFKGWAVEETDYAVKYLEQGTDKVLAEEKLVTNVPVGAKATERAIEIQNYDLVGEEMQPLVIDKDADKNVINFYYTRAKSNYVIRYIDVETAESLLPDIIGENKNIGEKVTEEAIPIDGYDLVSDETQEITLVQNIEENVITFYYERALTGYIVRYVEEGTDKALAEQKQGEETPVGEKVTEEAIPIVGYELVSESPKDLTITRNIYNNVITFYYTKVLKYTVYYLEEGTDKALAEPKLGDKVQAGKEITEDAIPIDGYDLVSETPQSIIIKRDESKNVIKFYYTRALASYEVKYLEMGTEKEIAPTKTVDNQKVGAKVREDAIPIDGYDLVSEDPQSIVIDRDADNNEIIFYYEKKALADYEVRYLEEGTDKQLANPKSVCNEEVGDTVTEDALEITNYDLVSESSQQLTITKDNDKNIIKFYYTRALASYIVRYLDKETGEDICAPWIATNQPVGDRVIEEAPSIKGYDLFSPSPRSIVIDRNVNNNIIIFYYNRRLMQSIIRPNLALAASQSMSSVAPEIEEIESIEESSLEENEEIIPEDDTAIEESVEENLDSEENSEEITLEPEVIEEAPIEVIEEEISEESEPVEEVALFGMVGNPIGELLGDPEGNYRYWDFENDEFYYDTELIAVWEPITYTISYEGVDGLENPNPTEYTVETETFSLVSLEKSGYSFEGWYTSEGNKVSEIIQGSTGNLVLHPQRKDTTPKYSGGGSRSTSVKKSTDNKTTENKDETKKTETHNSADEKTTKDDSLLVISQNDENKKQQPSEAPESVQRDVDRTEMVEAYNFARENGITTKETFEDADTDGLLIRRELAKMLSEYAVNVMGMEPEEGKAGCESFNDIAKQTDEMKGYMKTACELGLMGLESDGETVAKNFNPNKSVTRAEFGTTLSRLLYGGVNNLHNAQDRKSNEWYEKHLRALKDNGIMTQVEGEWVKKVELRGYVMIMLMRSAK